MANYFVSDSRSLGAVMVQVLGGLHWPLIGVVSALALYVRWLGCALGPCRERRGR